MSTITSGVHERNTIQMLFKNIDYSKKEVLLFSSLGIAFALVQHLLWHLSSGFELVPNLVSWFLPAGFRLFIYLIAPIKSWLFIYLFSLLANLTFIVQGGSGDTAALFSSAPLVRISFLVTTPLLFMGFVWFYRSKYSNQLFTKVESTLGLFALAITAASYNAIGLYFRKWLESAESANQFEPAIFQFIMGDLVGMALVIPLCLILWTSIKETNEWALNDAVRVITIWTVLVCVFFVVAIFTASFDYFLKMSFLVPAIYLSYRYERMGACITVVSICLITYLSALMIQGPTIENQFYIITISVGCLLLGAASNELRTLNEQLEAKNALLKNELTRSEALTRNLINLQESERKELSRDLHDDFGHRIVDLKLQLNIAKINKGEQSDHQEHIGKRLDSLYAAMKNSIGKLRPQGIDILTLSQLLKNQDLSQTLYKAGVKYEVSTTGTEHFLSEEVNLNLYRIVQESISNTIKHAHAKNFAVSIDYANTINFVITDDGCGYSTDTENHGLGLKFITERVKEIGASIYVDSKQTGTQISIRISEPNYN